MKSNCTLYTTDFSSGTKEETVETLRFTADMGVEKQVVNLYPQIQYQQFEGFGGAFTDSAGYVYARMSDENKSRLLNAYYGPGGLGYTLGRTHLDSCDFSLQHYAAIDEKSLQNFSLDGTRKHILPLLADAQTVYGKPIPLMAAPWSPPQFLKNNGERNGGGVLLKEHYEFYAQYLCHYIVQLRAAGASIVRLTVQNEPDALQTWDSCLYTPLQEKEFIRDFLYPALQQNGLKDVELFIWDHNKERVFERARDILDEQTSPQVAGIAFHWYSGDHFEALQLVGQHFPDKKLIQSEACIEYSLFSPDSFLANAQKYAHDIIGDLNNGMTAFYDWNLVLDEQGGPNHVGNYCDAPFLYHADTDQLEERASYAYIGHFSRYIKPGAKRIAFSRYCEAVEVTAHQNPDGCLAVVFLNRSDETLPVNLRLKGAITSFELKAQSIATLTIKI